MPWQDTCRLFGAVSLETIKIYGTNTRYHDFGTELKNGEHSYFLHIYFGGP